jgi:hypothetical protein
MFGTSMVIQSDYDSLLGKLVEPNTSINCRLKGWYWVQGSAGSYFFFIKLEIMDKAVS